MDKNSPYYNQAWDWSPEIMREYVNKLRGEFGLPPLTQAEYLPHATSRRANDDPALASATPEKPLIKKEK